MTGGLIGAPSCCYVRFRYPSNLIFIKRASILISLRASKSAPQRESSRYASSSLTSLASIRASNFGASGAND
jgi:hypothetical protein